MQSEDPDPLRYLFARLSTHAPLATGELDRIRAHMPRALRTKGARQDVITEGDHPHSVFLMLEGWACRYKELADGRRQIVSLFLPGDVGFSNVSLLHAMDHSIGTITPVRYIHIPSTSFAELLLRSPALSTAVHRIELAAMGVAHEWTTNLGLRRAPERIAHLLCELFLRMRAIGETEGNRCVLPLTQNDLASATGLTEIHVNRSLQELRKRNLLQFEGRILSIPNLDTLKSACMFTDTYLHLSPSSPPETLQPAMRTPDHVAR